MDDGWAERAGVVSTLIKRAFPDLRCPRCGHADVYLRILKDPDIAVGIGSDEIAETTCIRCGARIEHVVGLLERSVNDGKLPVQGADDDG